MWHWQRGKSERQRGIGESLTSLLLLESELSPVLLHAVSQGHPELGLLLQGHTLPTLLNVGQSRVGDGVGGSGTAGDGSRGGGAEGGSRNAAPQRGRELGAHHLVDRVSSKSREKGKNWVEPSDGGGGDGLN